jgi:phosphoserine phosphatase RsbX
VTAIAEHPAEPAMPGFAIAHASSPCAGQSVSGDCIVMRSFASGLMVAVVDALGHGPKAAAVAESARACLESLALPPRAGSAGVIEELHATLRETRGAAAMVCLLDGPVLDGAGVGNVELRAVGAPLPIVLSPGILGIQVRRIRSFSGRLTPGSRLFVFSDGISRNAPFAALARLDAEQACQTLLREHRHAHDDASVVALFFEAGSSEAR